MGNSKIRSNIGKSKLDISSSKPILYIYKASLVGAVIIESNYIAGINKNVIYLVKHCCASKICNILRHWYLIRTDKKWHEYTKGMPILKKYKLVSKFRSNYIRPQLVSLYGNFFKAHICAKEGGIIKVIWNKIHEARKPGVESADEFCIDREQFEEAMSNKLDEKRLKGIVIDHKSQSQSKLLSKHLNLSYIANKDICIDFFPSTPRLFTPNKFIHLNCEANSIINIHMPIFNKDKEFIILNYKELLSKEMYNGIFEEAPFQDRIR